jgi:type IV pilus assembly protein PilE
MTLCTTISRPAAAGFTLVELMVTMAIAAILAAIAIPAYNTSVRQSRRTEAKTALLDLAGREERYFNTNNAYTATAANLGYTGTFPMVVGSGYYKVSIAVTAGAAGVLPTYTISAVPATTDQLKDTQCLSFTLTNTGAQGATTMPTCWQ